MRIRVRCVECDRVAISRCVKCDDALCVCHVFIPAVNRTQCFSCLDVSVEEFSVPTEEEGR